MISMSVRMGGKSGVGRDPIFVDDAQRAKAHPLGIPKIAEAESVMAFQPAVIGSTAFFTGTNLNHGVAPFRYKFSILIN
jgi:hypothetical protein